ncbi:Peptidyl-prolyl cis-trans isomerase CYP18-1, partial [Bienertia sinuspersici]
WVGLGFGSGQWWARLGFGARQGWARLGFGAGQGIFWLYALVGTMTGPYFIETLKHNARGIMSMANSGANTNGSQFFMTYAKQPHLNGLYIVFGKVIHGFEVLDHMEKTISLYTYKATITKAQTYKDNKDVNQ